MNSGVQYPVIGCLNKNTIGRDEMGTNFCKNLDNDLDNGFYCFVSRRFQILTIFDPDEKSKIFNHSWKEHLKINKIAKFGREMLGSTEIIALRSLPVLYIFVFRKFEPLCRQRWLFFHAYIQGPRGCSFLRRF